MRKRGFTLIELMGVITILGVIILIAVPAVKKTISSSKDTLYDTQLVNIKDALKNWVVDNSRLLPENEGETITITLGQLKAGGYIDTELINPKNNKCFGNDMLLTVTRYQKNYIYNIEDETGPETDTCDNYLKPYIILNGEAIVYVELDSNYVDLGASAIGTDGTDITSNITTTISGSGDSIDTSVVGNKYIITYSITEGVNTTTINRTVIVRDSTSPELTIPGNVTLEAVVTSFDVMEGVSAIDNSGDTVDISVKSNISFGIPGEYIVTYTATDSSGNKTSKKRLVNIKRTYGNAILSSYNNCVLKGYKCKAGTSVEVYVNDSTKYNFYVINDTGIELTLIMDRNLGDRVSWYATATANSEGPLTALSALKERTSGWTNISETEYDVSDDGGGNRYKNFSVKMRARMLTYTEVLTLKTLNNDSTPSWLYENLSISNTIEKPFGYWLSSAASSPIFYAWHLRSDGGVYTINVTDAVNNGIRPVITLSK